MEGDAEARDPGDLMTGTVDKTREDGPLVWLRIIRLLISSYWVSSWTKPQRFHNWSKTLFSSAPKQPSGKNNDLLCAHMQNWVSFLSGLSNVGCFSGKLQCSDVMGDIFWKKERWTGGGGGERVTSSFFPSLYLVVLKGRQTGTIKKRKSTETLAEKNLTEEGTMRNFFCKSPIGKMNTWWSEHYPMCQLHYPFIDQMFGLASCLVCSATKIIFETHPTPKILCL